MKSLMSAQPLMGIWFCRRENCSDFIAPQFLILHLSTHESESNLTLCIGLPQQTRDMSVAFPMADVVGHCKCELPRCSTAFQNVTLRLWRAQCLEQGGQHDLREMLSMCMEHQRTFEDKVHNLFLRLPCVASGFCLMCSGTKERMGVNKILHWNGDPLLIVYSFLARVIKRLKYLSFDSLIYCNILCVTGCSKSCL